MKYDTVRAGLRSGDVLLFSGNGLFSRIIQLGSMSKWSHVGMVLLVEEWDMVLCWESTSLGSLADIETGKATQGVQLVPLRERLATYDGTVATRRLLEPLNEQQCGDLRQFRHDMRGLPYETHHIELAMAALDFTNIEIGEDLSSIFCSELVAEAMRRCGVLGLDKLANEYTPGDFEKLPMYGETISLEV